MSGVDHDDWIANTPIERVLFTGGVEWFVPIESQWPLFETLADTDTTAGAAHFCREAGCRQVLGRAYQPQNGWSGGAVWVGACPAIADPAQTRRILRSQRERFLRERGEVPRVRRVMVSHYAVALGHTASPTSLPVYCNADMRWTTVPTRVVRNALLSGRKRI